jgi:serine/threonine-protein kinase
VLDSCPIGNDERTWAPSIEASHAGSRGLRPALVVSGRYRIGSLLGAGGMGLVYEAEHLGLGLDVAIKVLRPELIEHPAVVSRFHHEARCAAKLRGEHVVRVLDQGRLETGLPFFVMERLRGLDLRAVLQACSVLPVALTVNYGRQVCSALAEAHAQGIVHCDVKPSNLFVTSEASNDSRIKLLDFGIAKQQGVADDGEQFGTSSYASPEQTDAPEHVDQRSDIWSLGVVLFEALVGSKPLVTSRLGLRRLDTRPLDARTDVPEGLRSVVLRCLAEDRAARFGTAAALAAALEPFGIRGRGDPAAVRVQRRRSLSGGIAAGAAPPRVRLWSDAQLLRSLRPPRRSPVRARPLMSGALDRAG